MEAKALEKLEELDGLKTLKGLSVIFKHNTTCPISMRAIAEFDANLQLLPPDTHVFVLDLLNHRDISNAIAEDFGIKHESPQMLVLRDGRCIFHQSHFEISAEDAATAMRQD